MFPGNMNMNFQKEMQTVFLNVISGEVEPEEWERWWNSHKAEAAKALSQGDQLRIMPASWKPDYGRMAQTQSGIAHYFYAQGRPVSCSGYYQKKALEEETRRSKMAMDAFWKQAEPARRRWEQYLKEHPTQAVTFDWKRLLGMPPAQKPPQIHSYQEARTEEQWKEAGAELKLCLKENMQAKIAPLARAYGMKKAGPQTFVKERNGLVWRLQFIGYFRGGGYETIQYYLCPIYAVDAGILGIPAFITNGEHFQKMRYDWGVIQYGTSAVDAARMEKINRKFDEILEFLADGVFPEWQNIDGLETYFAGERRDYLKALEKGPVSPRTNRPAWETTAAGETHPWRADGYLFGVWNLLLGNEEEGYRQLEECVTCGSDFMSRCLKERPKAYNDKRDVMAVLYHNAALFAQTKQVADTDARRHAILDTYQEVCRFMRYYHGLSGRVERE